MANTGNKIYNLYINSANRLSTEKPYDFTIYFDNDDILVNANEGMNVNLVSFSMLNSIYNVNQYTSNNLFNVINSSGAITSYSIPFGNYNAYTLADALNTLLSGKIQVVYNIPTNTYTYTNLTANYLDISPINCKKLLGISTITRINANQSITSTYINMVDYQQIIIKCPTLVFENCSMDNIQDKNNNIAISDFLYWVNKQDIEPFKMINYRNEDCSTLYSYNVLNTRLSLLNFKLVNELNQPIYDAPDFLMQIQISVFDKDNNYFKEASLQLLKLVNDIYFILLSLFSVFGVFKRLK
jgi:hypothetical protein